MWTAYIEQCIHTLGMCVVRCKGCDSFNSQLVHDCIKSLAKFLKPTAYQAAADQETLVVCVCAGGR